MQDRYAGDVGDFSKFALLRTLSTHLGGSIGLIWYRFPDETHNKDGRHIGYLTSGLWAQCDVDLMHRLRKVVVSEVRSVASLETAGILPIGSCYFGEEVHPREQSNWRRTEWFERARRAVSGCDIVFVDPDNGIAGPNHRPGSSSGGKHITLDEIQRLANDHSCVGIYHHFDRSASHSEQTNRQFERLRSLAPNRIVSALRYRRISPRAYFLVYNAAVAQQVETAMQALCTGIWERHFQRF